MNWDVLILEYFVLHSINSLIVSWSKFNERSGQDLSLSMTYHLNETLKTSFGLNGQ